MALRCALIFGLIGALTSPAQAQNFVYPSRGQSSAQQKNDEASCYSWAVQQTGFDPANPPPSQAPPAKETTATGVTPGAGVKGAVVGAAGGAGIGAIGGNAGTGAAAGAVGGAIIARSRSRRQNAAQAQAGQQAQQAAQQQQVAGFGRARGACLEGRGYTVK
jgi:hypothetical protein